MKAVTRWFWLLPILAACDPQYGNVRRNARVPHASVPLSSGQPLGRTVELSAGLANTADVLAPSIGDHSQAVEVPELEMRDELRFPIGALGHGALIYEKGFARTNRRLDDTQVPVGAGDVNGYGVAAGYAWRTDTPGLVIAGRLEVMGWSVPYVERRVSDNDSGTAFTLATREVAFTLGVGIAPSYRRGRVTYFGGLYLRNHPTTTRDSENVDLTQTDNLRNGPLNVLLDVGIEVTVAHWLGVLAVLHQDVISDPVNYGPGVGVALNFRLGD